MESIQRFIIFDPTTLSLYPHNHPVFGFDYTFSEAHPLHKMTWVSLPPFNIAPIDSFLIWKKNKKRESKRTEKTKQKQLESLVSFITTATQLSLFSRLGKPGHFHDIGYLAIDPRNVSPLSIILPLSTHQRSPIFPTGSGIVIEAVGIL